ncbi:MAG: hypothetical protein ACP5OA_06835 [Candidatus Woesearchaeota archaeon]
MSENTYEKLVSKVKGVDYIVGPGMKFTLNDSLKKTHKSDLDKMCGCSGNSKIGCEEYNLSLLADFLYNLEKQASQNATIGTPNPLALYFKKKETTDFIATDNSGKKYIALTEEGVALFREIWDSGREICYHDTTIPFSKLEKDGFNITKEAIDITTDGKPIYDNQATLVKDNKGPSIIALNKYSSIGPVPVEKIPDESIVGSRKPLRGSYRSQKF